MKNGWKNRKEEETCKINNLVGSNPIIDAYSYHSDSKTGFGIEGIV